MMLSKTQLHRTQALAFGITLGLAMPLAVASSTTLPNGANLSVTIDDPVTGTEFIVPHQLNDIFVQVTGEASIGEGEPNIDLVYVLDVSGSTVLNDCDASRTILDCEVDAILNVQSSPNITSVKGVGVAIFADGGNTADMPGLLIDQNLNPNNVATVVNSAHSNGSGNPAGVTQFTPRTVGAGATDFSSGLQAATSIISTGTGATRRVVFLSDGVSTQATAPGGFAVQLTAMVGTGAVVDAFAVGAGSDCADGDYGTLQQIADDTGGTCTNVTDPAILPGILEDLLFTSLDEIQVAVDSVNVLTNTVPGLPADGPLTATFDADPVLGFGDYNVTATADGHDKAGPGQVVTDVDIHLLQLTAGPDTEINELNTDTSHTVTAAILGGTGPDRNIDFLVGGMNASTAIPGNAAIPAVPGGASVDFVYEVPQECASLGTDTILVSTTIAGVLDSIELEKEWIDTVPPVPTCDEGVNPAGKKIPASPGKGGKAQNPDGFYQLNAVDFLGCAVTLAVMDGEGFVYTDLEAGNYIKYTEDNDRPQGQEPGAGVISWHLWGHGELYFSATDTSGNVSADAACFVPPPPK